MTGELRYRPRFAAVGRAFWALAGVYLALGAAFCWSLSTWAISGSVAGALFAVYVLVLAVVVVRTFARTSLTVDSERVVYLDGWGRRTRVLNRSEIVRVISIGRIHGGLVPGGSLIILARDGDRIGAGHWLWDAELLDRVAATVAGGYVQPEHWPSVRPYDLLRELGVDPAVRRSPLAYGAMMVISAAAGVLIAWPLVTALL